MSASCIICLDSFAADDDRICCCAAEPNHFLCTACMNLYLQENVLTKPFVLINQTYPFNVVCPCPGCEECLDIIGVWSKIDALPKLRYVNLIKEFVYHPDLGKMHVEVSKRAHDVCKQLHNDALTLKCQSCFVSVDPSADGCSAVQCMSCGLYFCGCCLLSGFDKTDSARDRAEAHIHAATHHPSGDVSERNAFLPVDIVCSGNQCFKRNQVRSVLLAFVDACESVGDIRSLSNVLSIGILCCSAELQEVCIEITVLWQQVLSQLYNRKLGRVDSSFAAPAYNPNATVNDVKDKVGGQILSYALLARNAEAARQILSSASSDLFDINFLDPSHGHPLLTLALLMGDLISAVRLIALGANPMQTNRDGRNALYLAIETGNWSIAQIILEANPSVSVDEICTTEMHRYTALHVAVRYNNTEAVYGLLKCGANLSLAESEYGYTPLTLATVLNNDCIYVLIADLRTPLYAEHNPDGRTALFVMCENGLTDMLSMLVKSRPDFDLNKPVTRSGQCVLHVAARYHQPFFVHILLAHCSVEHLNLSIQGLTPLHMSILAKCESTACLILAVSEKLGEYPGKAMLNLATELGLIRVLKELIRSRSFTQEEIGSCLEVALVFAQYDTLEYLLSIDIDLYIPGALQIACQRGDCWGVQQLLFRESESARMKIAIEKSAVLAVQNGCNSVIRLLLQRFGLDPNAEVRVNESEVVTLLQIARLHKHQRTVEILIELGAYTR